MNMCHLLHLKQACDERTNLLNDRPEHGKIKDLFKVMKSSQKNRAVQFLEKNSQLEISNNTSKAIKCLRRSLMEVRIRGERNQRYR